MATHAIEFTTNPPANMTYQKELAAARATLAKLQAALDKHAGEQRADPAHWGYVGELADTNVKLRQMAAFLDGDPRWDER